MNQTTAPGQQEAVPASDPPAQSLPQPSLSQSSLPQSSLPPSSHLPAQSSTQTEAPPSLDFQTWFELTRLYADYAAALDAGDWYRWADFFTEECSYKLQPRENFERGFPLCTLSFESRGMLKDRAFGISETIFHDPYYQRHVTGLPRILKVADGVIESEAGYAVFRTKSGELSTVFNVGRYIDRIVRTAEGLKFQSRLCVFDSEMIPNSIIYPI